MTVIDFPGGFPEQLCREGRETVSIEIRAAGEKLERLHQMLAECDRLIWPLEEEPKAEA
jgi:hypothetical protein